MNFNECLECSSMRTTNSSTAPNELCKDCYLIKMVFKFKAYFNKQKFRFDKNILVVCSKNTTSLALLHLLREILDGNSINNSSFEIFCLYINENRFDEKSKTEQHHTLCTIMEKTQDLQFKCYTASMATFFANQKEFIHPLTSATMECDSKYTKLLESFLEKSPDSTAKQELLVKLRKKLIVSVSKQLNCNTVILDNFASELAAEIVSNIVLGHGVSISLKNYCGPKKSSGVKFLYPMQIFIQDEITRYLQYKNYTNIKLQQSSENKTHKISIQDITQNFICKLDDNNLTTSTICKLSEKISSDNKKESSKNFCIFCNKFVQSVQTAQKLSTEFAKCFSEHVSTFKKTPESLMKLFAKINNKNEIEPITFNDLSLNLSNYYTYDNQSRDQNYVYILCYSCSTFLCKYGFRPDKIVY